MIILGIILLIIGYPYRVDDGPCPLGLEHRCPAAAGITGEAAWCGAMHTAPGHQVATSGA